MKKFVVALVVLTMMMTGCTQKEVESTSLTKTSEDTAQKYGAGLYKIGDAEVVEDLITGDLLLVTFESSYGSYKNTIYRVYKHREDICPETIENLKKFGYKDPLEQLKGDTHEPKGE